MTLLKIQKICETALSKLWFMGVSANMALEKNIKVAPKIFMTGHTLRTTGNFHTAEPRAEQREKKC